MSNEKESIFSAKNLKYLTSPFSANNPVIVQILGICSALAVTVQMKPAIVMALSASSIRISATMQPGLDSITSTRVPIYTASSMLCVTKSASCFLCDQMFNISSCMFMRVNSSSAPRGSSSSNISGSLMSVRTSATRCAMPPESCAG